MKLNDFQSKNANKKIVFLEIDIKNTNIFIGRAALWCFVTNHCMRFAGASLAIGKHRTIVS